MEKVRDIVGLYLSPPERAVVPCVDEKSQVQALDRTQPLLPMRPGQGKHSVKAQGIPGADQAAFAICCRSRQFQGSSSAMRLAE